MGQLAQRAAETMASQQRLRGLLTANSSIVAELSLTTVCQRIVEAARETAGARYAALGVIGPDGGLDTLAHSGTDDDTVAGIAAFPVGRGLPEGHPEMRSFLGVPVLAGGTEYGRLFLADPLHGGDFSEQDEELVAALAATAGIAVENARLYEESRRRQEWLLASSKISQRLMGLTERQEGNEVWRLITATVRQLADAEVVSLIMPVGEDRLELEVTVVSGTGHDQLEGLRYPRAGSVAGEVMQDGRRVVLSSGANGEIRDLRGLDRRAGPAMVLPLRGELGSRGVLAIGRQPGAPPFTSADVDMAEDFADQAANATELASVRSAQQRLAALEDRERIARDLHDHVIQRLFATGLTLRSTAVTTGSPILRQRLSDTVEELDETIRQIRSSIFALKYSQPAVSSIRASTLTAVDDVSPALRFRPATHLVGPLDTLADESLVADVSAVLHEALTNVVRHARARSASVSVTADAGWLTVVVVDDGLGIGPEARLSGLAHLRDRAELRSGTLTLDEPQGGGTQLTWSIPLA